MIQYKHTLSLYIMDLRFFAQQIVGGVFREPISSKSVPMTDAETLLWVIDLSNAKKLEVYEYYDGVNVLFCGEKFYLCDPGTKTDPYFQETLETLGKCLHLFKTETLTYDSRFKSELGWSWMKTKPSNLKHLRIPFLGDMSPSITRGLESLNLTEAGEEWDPIEDEKFAITYQDPDILGLNQPYDGVGKVIFGTTRKDLDSEETKLLRSRFPNSVFEFDDVDYKPVP